VKTVTHFDFAHRLAEGRHETLVNRLLDMKARWRHAHLAGIAHFGVRQESGGGINVCIGKNQHRSMAASCLPTGTEPVKDTLATSGDSIKYLAMSAARSRANSPIRRNTAERSIGDDAGLLVRLPRGRSGGADQLRVAHQ
jgi:hypothetical protein